MNSHADYKQQAALQALELVRSEMVLGLGSGSTIAHFIDGLGARLRSGQLQRVIGVPTSLQTAQRAKAAGIAMAELAAHPHLDLAVDGADGTPCIEDRLRIQTTGVDPAAQHRFPSANW